MKRGVLALIGPNPDLEPLSAAAAGQGLVCAGAFEGMHVFAGDGIPVCTLADGALLLGDIFSRTGVTCHAPSDGWGNYLAFEARGAINHVLRAPLTGMSFYWVRYGTGVICASHLELLAPLIPQPAIDWESVAQGLVYNNLRSERTGLGGVAELLPGMTLEVADGSVRVIPNWSPWGYAAETSSLGTADLSGELERRTIACVSAWSSARPEIILELSGGLDSSIVAAALSAAGVRYRAITFVTPGADGDERLFASAVTDHLDVELIELPHDDSDIDLIAPPAALLPRPGAYGVLGGIDRAFRNAAFDEGTAVFGGIGGDNVFAFDTSVAPILDAFERFGSGRKLFDTMRDVARAANTTLWHAARLAVQARRVGPRGWRRETSFCNEANMPVHPFAHPWDAGAAGMPRGKRNHVAAIRRILDFLDRPGRWQGRDVVAPLLSQPLVELCLSIPSWIWFTGGRDRAVARAAFARRLPPEIVWRRGKGQLETLCSAAYLAQRHRIRALLLDGRLAEEGLLDRDAIEVYLAREPSEGDFDYLRLLEIADAERWIRAVEASPAFGPSLAQR